MTQHALTAVLAVIILFFTVVGAIMGKISPFFEWSLGGAALAVLCAAAWGFFDLLMNSSIE